MLDILLKSIKLINNMLHKLSKLYGIMFLGTVLKQKSNAVSCWKEREKNFGSLNWQKVFNIKRYISKLRYVFQSY